MKHAKPHRFRNELGNTISINGQIGSREPFNLRGVSMVHYQIEGPSSKTENSITIREAEALRDLLIELVGAP